MSEFLLAKDTISGGEGKVLVDAGGRIRTFAHIKSLTATVAKNKATINTLGGSGQQKAVGKTCTGSMTYYYGDSTVLKLMQEYVNTGRDTYFTIIVTNDDPSSSVGLQTVKLTDVSIDNAEIAKIDVDATTALETTSTFTFRTYEVLSSFKEI